MSKEIKDLQDSKGDKMKSNIPISILKQQALVDSIKGVDMKNYQSYANSLGVTLDEFKQAMSIYKQDFKNAPLYRQTVVVMLKNRINDATKLELSSEYISGLKDALKLVGKL